MIQKDKNLSIRQAARKADITYQTAKNWVVMSRLERLQISPWRQIDKEEAELAQKKHL